MSIENKPAARLVSLDVFRGIIIAGMILVTNPGTYEAIYPQLQHAEWNGATATDMIFPAFLFMVGLSIALSFHTHLTRGTAKSKLAKHILYRSIVLFLLGLAINGFPDYNLPILRLPGILQRIAVCYFCCGVFYLCWNDFNKNHKTSGSLKNNLLKLGATAFSLLIIYWAILVLIPVPGIGTGHLDSFRNLPAYIDRKIIGINHMWAYGLTPGMGVTYDPEGILSTLPAISSTLIGLFVGEWWRRTSLGDDKKIMRLSIAGILFVSIAIIWSNVLPINKRIWTSSFVMLSSGVAMLLFSVIYIVVDLKKLRKWSVPFLIPGTNAILAFVISSVITTLNDRIKIFHLNGEPISIHQWGYHLSLSLGLSPVNASLLYGIVIVLLNILIVLPLYRKKFFLKV